MVFYYIVLIFGVVQFSIAYFTGELIKEYIAPKSGDYDNEDGADDEYGEYDGEDADDDAAGEGDGN